MPCEMCTDPDGIACFPMYGLGPHHHEGGGTTLTEKSAPGFTPDPDCPGMGVWWCPHCGDGKPEAKGETS